MTDAMFSCPIAATARASFKNRSTPVDSAVAVALRILIATRLPSAM